MVKTRVKLDDLRIWRSVLTAVVVAACMTVSGCGGCGRQEEMPPEVTPVKTTPKPEASAVQSSGGTTPSTVLAKTPMTNQAPRMTASERRAQALAAQRGAEEFALEGISKVAEQKRVDVAKLTAARFDAEVAARNDDPDVSAAYREMQRYRKTYQEALEKNEGYTEAVKQEEAGFYEFQELERRKQELKQKLEGEVR